MTSWFVLFLVQARLIASRRIHLHRRLGILGAVLAGLMVIVGATVALRDAARDLHRPRLEPLQAAGGEWRDHLRLAWGAGWTRDLQVLSQSGHSPAEVLDLNDLRSLAWMVRVLAQ